MVLEPLKVLSSTIPGCQFERLVITILFLDWKSRNSTCLFQQNMYFYEKYLQPDRMAKTDIDLEKELWDVASELRGAVSKKNYILPLKLFCTTSITNKKQSHI